MLKFWRSPKIAHTKERSPSPTPPPTTAARPDPPPPAVHLHGLGLGLPPALGSSAGHVSGQAHGEQGERARTSSAQGASTSPRSTQTATASPDDRDSQDRLHGNTGILRERNGQLIRTVSAASTSSSSHPAAAPHKPAQVDRSLSPTSLSPSLGHSLGTRQYGGVASIDFADRDPTQIYAPTTWSEMAHQDLVNNLSPRERTRQEILWEVVASEERYVAELRSLVNLYANKLLHTLAPSPSLTPSPRFGCSPELGAHPHAHAHPSASTSTASLPIASRFARTPTPEPDATAQREDAEHARTVRIADVPDMDGAPSAAMRRGGSSGTSTSAPHLVPNGGAGASSRRHASSSTLVGPRAPSSAASSGSSPNLSVSSRIASAFRSSRHSSRTSPSAPSTSASTSPSVPEAPLVLPVELRDALEACVEMLRGHDELSARLKEQWARAFPLVRGLAAIWSDQPWFLGTYTTYVLSLEPALASLDRLLPSSLPHSHASTSSSSAPPQKLSPADKRLARALHDLELEAADLGETGLGICLSKPLMRLGKLPLLMQALLYHTDPTTHEWEKTRAMALEVDALVRSIEDEKVEEEERERTRDALARIDGVKDKTLMAPRAARILISEYLAPSLSQSAGPSTTTSGSTRAKFARRMSGAVGGGGKKGSVSGKGAEWLICFTDVVVRAIKTGETSIPGSFSREKEKRGKQGAPRKVGKTRNTYRFVRVERWEPPEFAAQKLEELNERRRTGRAPVSDDEELEDEDEDGFDVESRMSFRYDADSPQPILASPRSFLSPSKHSKRAPSPSSMSPSLAQPSSAKFGTRLRAETPVPHPLHHAHPHPHPQSRSLHPYNQPLRATTPFPPASFDAPTVSSQAKVHGSPPPPPHSLPTKPREAAKESSSNGSLAHARDQSSFALYQMWAGAQDDD